MFDYICKFLIENFSTDFATWLIGKPITLTRLSPTELSLEPIRADSILLLQAEKIILHIEFQTRADGKIPFRMLDYCVRIHRQFPKKELRQFVIYLKPGDAPSLYQSTFELPRTRHEFDVIRLWEQPVEPFLAEPGLLPFAALAQTEDRAAILRQVADQISEIANVQLRGNISTSAGILSTLILNKELVSTILGRSVMQDSALYRSILDDGLEQGRELGIQLGLEEGLEKGLEKGREEGREEGQREFLIDVLTMKLGALPEPVTAEIQKLSQADLQALKSSLFSLESLTDLENWLRGRQA